MSNSTVNVPAGTYYDVTSSQILAVPVGTYSPGGTATLTADGWTGLTAPIAAPAGTYTSTTGSSVPTLDPAGTFSLAGASSPTFDPPGTYGNQPGQSAPTIDPSGTYTNTSGSTAPILDPLGTFSVSVGAVGPIQPVQDPPGTYGNQLGQSAPTIDPAGTYTSAPGSTAPIQDPAGTFSGPGASAATVDPVGTYSGPGASVATQAGLGYYVPVIGASSETAAQPGYYVATTGASAQTPVGPGFYQPNAAASSAIIDPAGTYTSSYGSTAPTTDVAGTFSLAGAATATRDPAGTYGNLPGQSAPIQDPAGTFTSSTGSTAPIQDLAGTFSGPGASAATVDPVGTYSGPGASVATPASAGYYVPVAGSSSELAAQPGYFVSTTGASAQTIDPAGTYTDISGSTAPIQDPAGTFSGPGASAATIDPVGTYSGPGASAATQADAGYYVSVTGASSETAAQPGYYVATTGASAQTPVDPGYYQPNAAATDEIPLLAPTIALGSTVVFAGAGTTTTAFAGSTVTDPNSGLTDTLTITLSDTNAVLQDGAVSGTLTGGNGTYTITGSADAITSELSALQLTVPGALDPTQTTSYGVEAIGITLSDTVSGAAAGASTATGTTSLTAYDVPADITIATGDDFTNALNAIDAASQTTGGTGTAYTLNLAGTGTTISTSAYPNIALNGSDLLTINGNGGTLDDADASAIQDQSNLALNDITITHSGGRNAIVLSGAVTLTLAADAGQLTMIDGSIVSRDPQSAIVVDGPGKVLLNDDFYNQSGIVLNSGMLELGNIDTSGYGDINFAGPGSILQLDATTTLQPLINSASPLSSASSLGLSSSSGSSQAGYSFGHTIADLALGDLIDLSALSYAQGSTASFDGTVLSTSNGLETDLRALTLSPDLDPTGSNLTFGTSSDGSGGTDVQITGVSGMTTATALETAIAGFTEGSQIGPGLGVQYVASLAPSSAIGLGKSVLNVDFVGSDTLTIAGNQGAITGAGDYLIEASSNLTLSDITLTEGRPSKTASNGDAILLNNNVTLTLIADAGDTTTINGGITDTLGGSSLIIDGPGKVVLNGTNTVGGGVTLNSGTLDLVTYDAGGISSITFAGADATLEIDAITQGTSGKKGSSGAKSGGSKTSSATSLSPIDFANTINDMAVGDIIDLASLAYAPDATATLSNKILTVTSNGTSATFALSLAPNVVIGQNGLALEAISDGNGGTDVELSYNPPVASTISGTVAGQMTTSETPISPFATAAIGDTNANATDTLTISLDGAGGTLADGAGFAGPPTLSGSGATYTLTGTAAAITAELHTLSFTPTGGQANTTSITTFTLSDSNSVYGTPTVDTTTSVIDVDPAVASTISGTIAGQTTLSEAALKPFAGVTIADANANATETLSIIVNDNGNGQGMLSGTGLTATGLYNVFTLTGSAATVTSELNALSFVAAKGQANTTSTTTFTLSDSNSVYGTPTVDTTTSVIDKDPAVASTISGTVAGQTTLSEAALKPFAGVTIADANANATETLTITLGGAGGTLSGTGLATTGTAGVYTISGAAATVTSELDALSFVAAKGQANTTSTTTFTLSDSNSVYGTPTVDTTTSVIDKDPAVASTISGTVAGQTTLSEAALKPFAGVTIADANANATETLTITLGGAGGTLSGTGLATTGTAGVYTISGAAATVTSELDALSFVAAKGQANTTSTTTFTLSDKNSVYATSTVDTKTSVIDKDPAVAPTVTGAISGQIFGVQTTDTPFSKMVVTDTNFGTSDTVRISVTGGGTLSGTGLSLTATPGVYQLAATSAATATQELETLVYTPVANASHTAQTIAFAISDTTSASTSVVGPTTTITIDPGPTTGKVTTNVQVGGSVNLTSAILAAASAGIKGDTLTITADSTGSTLGSVSLVNGQIVYSTSTTALSHIAANGSQADTFGYTISDQYGDKATGSVAVTVTNPANVINGGIFGFSTIQGTPSANIINAYGWFNTIYDNGGNDVVNAGQGNATVYTSTGDVVTHLDGYFNTVSGGNGWNTVSGSDGTTSVTLGNGTDSVSTDGYFNTITLGNGNDTIAAGQGSETVVAGNGNDLVTAGGYFDTITLGNGTNSVSGGQGLETITVGNGNNTIVAGGYSDQIRVGAGTNTISGGQGLETIVTGAGTDTITIGGTNNLVTLNGSHATVTGGQGGDTITMNDGSGQLTFAGWNSIANLNGTVAATINDLGHALAIRIGSSTQTDVITGFGTSDPYGVVDLLNGAGGYSSTAQIMSHLTSDGHGGTLLALGTTGSIDFAGTTVSHLSAANFKVG